MANAFGIVYGIIFVVAIVMFLDWYARRKDKQTIRQRPPT
jgi:hypothetical protein